MMATFDEIQVTTLLALTHPNSPYFLKAMAELRTLDIQKEYNKEIIDRVVLALLNDKALEKDLLVQEQLNNARETHAKYLQDYAAYQEAVYKQAFEDLNLNPAQAIDYMKTQNSTLEKELQAWEAKLKDLPKDQKAISEEWNDMQKKSGAELAQQFEGVSVVSLDGKASMLTPEQIDHLQKRIFNDSHDPNKLIKIVPSLVDPNPATVEITSAKMERARIVNRDLTALIEIKNLPGTPSADTVKVNDNMNLKPSELRRQRQQNQQILDIVNLVGKSQSNNASVLQARALITNESYINKQKEFLVNQMERNSLKAEKIMELAETKSSLPTPKPKGA